MKTYNVHLYEVVRVKVAGIVAESQVEAIKLAVDSYNPRDYFDRYAPVDHIDCIEWAEETVEYLVDEQGDEEYEETRRYDPSFKEIKP